MSNPAEQQPISKLTNLWLGVYRDSEKIVRPFAIFQRKDLAHEVSSRLFGPDAETPQLLPLMVKVEDLGIYREEGILRQIKSKLTAAEVRFLEEKLSRKTV